MCVFWKKGDLLVKLDIYDRRILSILQEDCSLPLAEIASRVGLSQTPCWRRIRKLETAGVVKNRVAILDPKSLGIGVTVFVHVRAATHNANWLSRFTDLVDSMPEITEVYRMSGQADYLLRVLVPDINDYDRFYRQLIASHDFDDVSSSFAMERIKHTTSIPLHFLEKEAAE